MKRLAKLALAKETLQELLQAQLPKANGGGIPETATNPVQCILTY